MADGSTEVRQGRKFDQVVEGATEVFMSEGFERASVDEIARKAGVSKATLYSYFPDKKLLFVEVMKRECERRAKAAEAFIDKSCPPQMILPLAGRILLDFFLSDIGQQSYRMCMTETEKFPELAHKFYESGPGIVERELIPYFEQAETRGELSIPDKLLATHQFHDLCRSHIFAKRLMGTQSSFTSAEKEHVISSAVEMFLARYGV